ncbi:lytic transglycosylase domain-containing protein [Roseovarius sp. CAU 1744]|uniref:lytic transglycosylase domain-containing protein n=1 Tax=Roseovarius sp. CAU 1744 TaxID=3140368 RepID=UPI00325B45AA
MLFGRDGSVSTTPGWVFHDKKYNKPNIHSRGSHGTVEILNAIRKTSERHANSNTVRQARLSADGWHILFRALIEAESAYRPTATSPKGAYGLGQLMPATARQLGVDRTDMAQNLDGAARYLLTQLADFQDIDLALAAYNAGPHRVREYGGVPPYRETRDYIARIHRIRARLTDALIQKTVRVSTRGSARPSVVLGLKR